NIQDTPRVFNVVLFENHANTANIRGTKAAGEPPLLLATSAWTAIRNALAYLRPKPNLHTVPATSERILRALENF
ncbi:MAG TPA: hypothetical protein PLH57_10430, partial [Oligoflexia bacterium]|nr:hypothetical protein [Oligoflexia bacterium]